MPIPFIWLLVSPSKLFLKTYEKAINTAADGYLYND